MNLMTPRFFKLPEGSGLSLRDQICEVVSSAITSQALAHHRPLPSCRELANQLNVSRNTVFAAYTRLIDLGFLISRDRSGYFVNPDAQLPLAPVGKDYYGSVCDQKASAPIEFEPSKLVPIENPLDWIRYHPVSTTRQGHVHVPIEGATRGNRERSCPE